jgi:hypothetical protein
MTIVYSLPHDFRDHVSPCLTQNVDAGMQRRRGINAGNLPLSPEQEQLCEMLEEG